MDNCETSAVGHIMYLAKCWCFRISDKKNK